MLQEKLIFFPERLPRDFTFSLGPNAREVFLTTKSGNEINGLFYKTPGSNSVILYFHGNAGSLRDWQGVSSVFTGKKLDFFIIDYHGYGKSSGEFSEAGFYDDGQAAYQFLLSESYRPEQVIVYGRSIGTGIAVDLASKQPVKALILESAFSSLLDLGREKYGFLFPGLWARYRFDNLKKLQDLRIPVLLLHGNLDSLIPPAHSTRLHSEMPGQRKQLVLIAGGHHNDLDSFPQYHQAVEEFVKSLP